MSRVFDDIRQVGYVTPDLERTVDFFLKKTGIGPWFIAERVPVETCTFRGKPLQLEMSIALANSGNLQLEFIQQTSEQPSIYTEWLDLHPDGDVPHHYSSWSDRYDEVYRTATGLGFEAVQEGRSGYGPFVYFQMPGRPGFTYEVTEFSAPRRRMFSGIAEAAVGWDGTDPIRYGWPS